MSISIGSNTKIFQSVLDFFPIVRLTHYFQTGNEIEERNIKLKNKNSAKITYFKNSDAQILAEDGISGKFSVTYDVERALDAGDLHVIDGFFVHAIAPEGLTPMPKNVLFILDVSASMAGVKIKQLKDAMWSICGEMIEGDQFNIMTFNACIDWMTEKLLQVVPENIRKAKHYVNSMAANGCKY